MTTLTNVLSQQRVQVKDETKWAVASILISALAVNIVPVVTGAAAFYLASKAGSTFLKGVSVAAAISGIVLGILSAI
ncbi:MAG: hypothetical protein ABIH39_07155 [Candidatus Margulisiibacteriota bacterium]